MQNIITGMLASVIDAANSKWFLHIGFLARNIFYVSDKIKVLDFETFENSCLSSSRNFFDGKVAGAVSPYQVTGMCLNNKSKTYPGMVFCD